MKLAATRSNGSATTTTTRDKKRAEAIQAWNAMAMMRHMPGGEQIAAGILASYCDKCGDVPINIRIEVGSFELIMLARLSRQTGETMEQIIQRLLMDGWNGNLADALDEELRGIKSNHW